MLLQQSKVHIAPFSFEMHKSFPTVKVSTDKQEKNYRFICKKLIGIMTQGKKSTKVKDTSNPIDMEHVTNKYIMMIIRKAHLYNILLSPHMIKVNFMNQIKVSIIACHIVYLLGIPSFYRIRIG